MEIKVCGPGCAKCKEAERVITEAVQETGSQASVTKVEDFAEIAKLGVFSTPAVLIDGQVKIVGRVPSRKDILEWIK